MEFKSVEGKDVIKNERFLLQSHAAWVSLTEMTTCNPELKITSEQLESAVEKLKVPLNRLHPDEMGGVVVGQERATMFAKERRILVDMIDVQKDGCWLWKGTIGANGYGYLTVAQKHRLAHRITYAVVIGLSPGLHVCHHCDNPPCVCPFHLYLGTQKENIRDAIVRGRVKYYYGENHVASRFKEVDILEIRRRHAAGGVSMRQLGREYDTDHAVIRNIIIRKVWKHI